MQAYPSAHHYTVSCLWNLSLGCKFLNFFVALYTEHTLVAGASNLTAPGFALVLGKMGFLLLRRDLTDGKQLKDQMIQLRKKN